jgi:hypothetical protein
VEIKRNDKETRNSRRIYSSLATRLHNAESFLRR